MAHLIAFLIIGAVKMVKWTLVKTRLFIVVLPVAIVLIFFKDWYETNKLMADGIGITLTACVVASWLATLVRYNRARKHNEGLVLDWVYERYGKPILLTRKKVETKI